MACLGSLPPCTLHTQGAKLNVSHYKHRNHHLSSTLPFTPHNTEITILVYFYHVLRILRVLSRVYLPFLLVGFRILLQIPIFTVTFTLVTHIHTHTHTHAHAHTHIQFSYTGVLSVISFNFFRTSWVIKERRALRFSWSNFTSWYSTYTTNK
jgi:hypothetical protein